MARYVILTIRDKFNIHGRSVKRKTARDDEVAKKRI
jgi:hypothetical protein